MGNEKPGVSVSVIVPIYNTEKYLSRCIESIRGQSLNELEIILIDDGSGDGSGQICDDYARIDPRIKVLHKENEGLVCARKAGLHLARGKYIGFVDSDDWIEADMFEFLFREAIDKNADIVADGVVEETDGACVYKTNALKAGIYHSEEERTYIYQNMLCCEEYFKIGILPYLCNKLIRRELAAKHIMTVDEKISVGEDAASVYPILMSAGRICITNQVHYHYCIRNTSMIRGGGRLDEEYAGLARLHIFLKRTSHDLGVLPLMEEQIERYSINNILVRAFAKYACQFGNTKLYPFKGIGEMDSILIYGAGAFGRAVFEYVSQKEGIKVTNWVDRDAQFYQRLGMQVDNLDRLWPPCSSKIVISVLSRKAAGEIKGMLLNRGFSEQQLIWLSIEKKDRELIISELESAYSEL